MTLSKFECHIKPACENARELFFHILFKMVVLFFVLQASQYWFDGSISAVVSIYGLFLLLYETFRSNYSSKVRFVWYTVCAIAISGFAVILLSELGSEKKQEVFYKVNTCIKKEKGDNDVRP